VPYVNHNFTGRVIRLFDLALKRLGDLRKSVVKENFEVGTRIEDISGQSIILSQ
jgi:hypothetical protein